MKPIQRSVSVSELFCAGLDWSRLQAGKKLKRPLCTLYADCIRHGTVRTHAVAHELCLHFHSRGWRGVVIRLTETVKLTKIDAAGRQDSGAEQSGGRTDRLSAPDPGDDDSQVPCLDR